MGAPQKEGIPTVRWVSPLPEPRIYLLPKDPLGQTRVPGSCARQQPGFVRALEWMVGPGWSWGMDQGGFTNRPEVRGG